MDAVIIMLIGSAVLGAVMFIYLQVKMCNNKRS